MGLRAKFNLVILAAFAVGFLIAAIVLNRVANDTARDQVLQNARIMMTAADAFRNYTANDLVRLLPSERDGKFVAETVPAYGAQTTFKQLQTTPFPASRTGRPPSIRPIPPIVRVIGRWISSIVSARTGLSRSS